MRSCLICDDHAMIRNALAGMVALHWPTAAVITAIDFPAGWAAAADQPELILCDLAMRGADPAEGVRRMREAAPAAALVVVTANEQDDALLLHLFDLGIAGFVPKSASGEIIEAAIRLVLAGGRYVPPRVIDLALRRGPGDGGPLPAAGIARLSDRQLQVLKLIARGAPNKEIARAMALSPATVKTHVATILAALDTTNRTEAAYRAREIGLL